MLLAVRDIDALLLRTGAKSSVFTCFAGLFERFEQRVVFEKLRVEKLRVLAEILGGGGWAFISRGTRIVFCTEPLRHRVCPGSVELSVSGEPPLLNLSVLRKGCSSKPPPNTVFCPRHFNTDYGNYIRYIFSGRVQVNRSNPFFRLPAFLYTVYYGSELIKIGTVISFKGSRRLLEQPGLLYSFILAAPSIAEARKAEVALSSLPGVSQAPSAKERFSYLTRASHRSIEEHLRAFACRLATVLRRARSTGILKEELKRWFTQDKPLTVMNIDWGMDTPNIRILIRSSDINKILSGDSCVVEGYAHGALLLNCASAGSVAVPYELLRDRVLCLELLKS
ncbi:MAG: hypothetical protein DRO39_05835 [Thermoprotei archaeon]|nr:MAG: hypothetical protein DRO39_05835 [Thermoprotei archaeon]